MIHNLSDGQPRLAAGRPERLSRQLETGHSASHHILKIAHLRYGRLTAIMAGGGHADIERVGQGQAYRAELRPRAAVHTGIPSKDIAHPLQPQPGARISDRRAAYIDRCSVGEAILEKAAANIGSGQSGRESGRGAQILARHESRLGPGIGEA